MPADRKACPSPAQLVDFSLGKVPADAADGLADHLEACPPCQATLSNFDTSSDTLIEQIRAEAAAALLVDSPECQQAVARIQALAPGAAQSHAPSPGDDYATQLSTPTESSAATQSGEATTADLVPPPAAAARTYGEYTVLDRLGAGGMGEVFKARHRRMNRVVALKVLPAAAVSSPDAVKRFQREVEAAARLSHPNIVTAYDAGEQDGVHYLVMEYVPGRDLSSLLRDRGPLPPVEAIGYVLQAARGLAYAHGKGVVHRDIKPANLLLDDEGTVKVLDMGLARFDDAPGAVGQVCNLSSQDGLTQSGQVMGTVDYMAPEQAFDTRQADARADIYSLGCTFYRLLTGESLYRGETLVQKLLAHREQPIPSLRASRPELPPELDSILRRMVAKQPGDRYASMNELVRALEQFSNHAPQSSHHAPRDEESETGDKPLPRELPHAEREAYKGRRPLAIAAALAGCVLLAGIIVIIRNNRGEVVARVPVPAGGSLSVESTDPPPVPASPNNPPTKPADPKPTQPPTSSSLKLTAPKKAISDAPLWSPPMGPNGKMLFPPGRTNDLVGLVQKQAVIRNLGSWCQWAD